MSNEVGYIDPKAVSVSIGDAFINEKDWKDVHNRESLKAKLIVLLALGGKFPDIDKKSWLQYKTSERFDVRMEVPHPDRGNQRAWRGISREDNGQLDARKIREKWWELVEVAQQAAEARRRRKEKRENAMDRREQKKEFVGENFEEADISSSKSDQLLPQGLEMGDKEAHIDARGTDHHRVQIYGLSEDELLRLRDFVESEF